MDANALQAFTQFLLPEGRKALVETIQDFKQTYGKDWIKKFNEENSEFSFLVDIVANYDAPDAFQELKTFVSNLINDSTISTFEKTIAKTFANATLNGNYSNILETHKALREAIDKPRF